MGAPDRYVGHVLGERYRLNQRVGAGGFGSVYLSEHVTLKRRFAIKVLSRQLDMDPRLVKRFEREAQLTASLEHPNIVQVTDFGQDDLMGSWFAMEYLQGEDLQQHIARVGRLNGAAAVRLMRQIVDAFVYAHRQGVIHRDVKSANVFLLSSDAVTDHAKVLDFGIARVMEAFEDTDAAKLTRTGTVMGSPAYMAPEQALNLGVDHRTDIYSLGIVLYQMVTGRVPFTATSALEVLNKQIREAPAAPSEIVPEVGVNPYLELVILCCLQKKMERRFATTEELAAALVKAEESIERGDDAPTELMSTLAELRAEMLEDGSLLADSSENDQRKIVAGGGYTKIQRELMEGEAARSRRRIVASLLGVLVVLALLAGAWWLGKGSGGPASPLPEKPTVVVVTGEPAHESNEAVGARRAVPLAAPDASIAADTATLAPTAVAVPTEPDPPAIVSRPLILDVSPRGAGVRWKDGKVEPPIRSGLIDVRPQDSGRSLVVEKEGYVARAVDVDYAALETEPRVSVKLRLVPRKAIAPKKKASKPKPKPKSQPPKETGGFLDGYKR
jgi:tRNA A-37 threonylcarbamoyl transferase component Bud32